MTEDVVVRSRVSFISLRRWEGGSTSSASHRRERIDFAGAIGHTRLTWLPEWIHGKSSVISDQPE